MTIQPDAANSDENALLVNLDDLTLTLRRPEPAEYPAVAEVLVRAYKSLYDVPAEYIAHLRDLTAFDDIGEIWAAWDGATPAGALLVIHGGGRSYVIDPPGPEIGFRILGVDPPYRGRGVAHALLDHVVNLGRGLGAEAVSLYTAPDMYPAHRLYEGYGFTRQPHRDTYIDNVSHPLWAYRYLIPAQETGS
jgi:putative glutathione S-transferase